LPAPLGPSKAKMLPAATEKLSPSSARTPPLYVLLSPRAATMAVAAPVVMTQLPNIISEMNSVLDVNYVYYRTAFSSSTLFDVTRSARDQERRDQERRGSAATSAPQPPWRSVPKRGRSAPRPQLSRDVVVSA